MSKHYNDLTVFGKLQLKEFTSGSTVSNLGIDDDGFVTTGTTLVNKQDFVLTERDIDLYWSSTPISGFELTDNGDGSVTIDGGIITLRNSNNQSSQLIAYNITGSTTLTLTNNTLNYIIADYNSNNPIITFTTSIDDFNCMDRCVLYLASRWDNNIVFNSVGEQGIDSNRKLRRRFFEEEPIKRVSGLILGNSGLKVTSTSGLVYFALKRSEVNSFNTNISDTFTYFYNSGGSWIRVTGQTDLDQVNIVSGPMTNDNRWKVEYVYIIPNSPDKLYIRLADIEYNSLANAKLDKSPQNVPPELQGMGILIGRFLIRKNNGVGEVESAFEKLFVGSTVINHNDTTGLNTGDFIHLTAAEYATFLNLGSGNIDGGNASSTTIDLNIDGGGA